jgi:FixJ family two-component response regulator
VTYELPPLIGHSTRARRKPFSNICARIATENATTEQRQLLRIRIVLEAADGFGTREIARELGTTPTTVSLWRGRFARERLDGLEDLPRSHAADLTDRAPPESACRWLR